MKKYNLARTLSLFLAVCSLTFVVACGPSRPKIKHVVDETLAQKVGGAPAEKIKKARSDLQNQSKVVAEKKKGVATAQGEIAKANDEMKKRKADIQKKKADVEKAKKALAQAETAADKAENGIAYADALKELAEKKVEYAESLIQVEEDRKLVLEAKYELQKFQSVAVSNGAKGQLYSERLKDFTTQLLATETYVKNSSGQESVEAKQEVNEAAQKVKAAKSKL